MDCFSEDWTFGVQQACRNQRIPAGAPRILVLGLNGLIGWHIFKQSGVAGETYGTYRKEHPLLANRACFRVNMHSVPEMKALLNRCRPEYLFHAWAMCDLDLCESMPAMAARTNIEGTKVLLEAAKGFAGLKKIIYLSTDHVFDGAQGPYDEEDRPDPIHVYGKTKYEAECLIRSSGFPFMILRPGLVIGQSLQGNKGPRDFLLTRIRAGKPTHYFTDEWRSPVRAEYFAAKAVDLGLSKAEGVFHIAGKRKRNRYELACLLARQNRLPTESIFPRLRKEDRWAHIRPKDLSLTSSKLPPEDYF